MALLPVEDALSRLLEGVPPKPGEIIPLAQASGRVLAQPVTARRTQPPFDASAMDGYAVVTEDVIITPVTLKIIGEAPAGKPFQGIVRRGEAVRIFTGAPVPSGADTVVIQENTRASGGTVEILETQVVGRNIRRAGLDFRQGEQILPAGRILDPGALSLAASANYAELPVVRRPKVAILATGDELLPPGSELAPGQIIASNSYGVAAISAEMGAEINDLGIARDDVADISSRIRQARDWDADVLVTLGGASVGDHDLVHASLTSVGMELDFWKIAMRPGKPLMFGRLGHMRCLGLPGNPVASLVCSTLFLKPLLAKFTGREWSPRTETATFKGDMPANDHRQDYVRALVEEAPSGLAARAFDIQDSSMLRTFADANALLVRPPFQHALRSGMECTVIRLR